jgi:hypothetical protein
MRKVITEVETKADQIFMRSLTYQTNMRSLYCHSLKPSAPLSSVTTHSKKDPIINRKFSRVTSSYATQPSPIPVFQSTNHPMSNATILSVVTSDPMRGGSPTQPNPIATLMMDDSHHDDDDLSSSMYSGLSSEIPCR